MKKFLGILVLGLLLVGCVQSEKKLMKVVPFCVLVGLLKLVLFGGGDIG